MVPFLKWPGGKRWFIANHAGFFPRNFNRYVEPFLGSGAVYFFLRPKRAILGDLNPDLLAVYEGLKQDWAKVQLLLERHSRRHGERYYYRLRAAEPSDLVERAARLIYLNRTCFNGVYRVNLEGKFNVPKGERDSVLFPTDNFEAASRLLSQARLRLSDFEPLINESRRGDLLFADPPYTVRHNNNAFIRYNEALFSWADQVRLANALADARGRGVKIVATNANHRSVRELYRKAGFLLKTVSRFSPISSSPRSRKQFEELVIVGNGNGASK